MLPQGYLDGFTSPSEEGQLWAFDRSQSRWFPTGTPAVAAIKGFYEYSPGSNPDQTADETFRELESKFPNVRKELIAENFSGWTKHRDFLLRFAQMIRARSELFRQEDIAHTRDTRILKVVEAVDRKLTYEPYRPKTQGEYATLLRNKAITQMRIEVKKGPAWFLDLNWCLRLAQSHTDPVITTDNPLVLECNAPTVHEGIHDPSSCIFFPICWRACLVGSRAKFDIETDIFQPPNLEKLRRMYFQSATRFVYSPSRLAHDAN